LPSVDRNSITSPKGGKERRKKMRQIKELRFLSPIIFFSLLLLSLLDYLMYPQTLPCLFFPALALNPQEAPHACSFWFQKGILESKQDGY
jgi:hypothetical protein